MHPYRVHHRRFAIAVLIAAVVSQPLFAQIRPGGGGAAGGGAAGGGAAGGAVGGITAGGGVITVGNTTVTIGPGGINAGGTIINIGPGGITVGGGATTAAEPSILAPRGGLAGDTLVAAAVIPNAIAAAAQPGSTTPATTASYQWTITGGRITSDPRTNPVQFVADAAGTVSLSVAINTNGTSYSPSAQVTILSPETAGTITAPATVATNAAPITASVPPAQNNDRTFRWSVSGDAAAIVSGQSTPNVTVRPGTPGLKELVCNVNFLAASSQNLATVLATVPVRSYVVVTGAGAPRTVTVNGGSGGGTYPAGSRVDVFADPPAAGEVFDRWTGNVEVLGAAAVAPSIAHSLITVPDAPITLTATYKAAPAWALTTVQNFNPQTQTGANNQTTTVSSTLGYYIPANANGVVFLVHDSGDSAAEWFGRPEKALLARDLVAAGYGVAALNSINRTNGAWSAQPTLANNLDAQNHAAALDKFIRDNALGATKPVFFIGEGNGANSALRFADMLAAATPARPVKGAVLYFTPGIEALAVTSRVPQFFALAANDESVGTAGITGARANSQLLTGRGVATNVITNGPAPVYPGRFRMLGVTANTFTPADAQTVWNAVKNAGMLDANNYAKTVPSTTTLAAALPTSLQPRAADVAAQLAVASARHEFFSDANTRLVNFLNARAADNPVPAPGRLVNLSTRTKIAYLGDTFALGFNISGPQRATLLIRGIGPALAKFGVNTALAAPRMEVNQGSTVIASNEGWDKPAAGGATAAQITAAAAGVGAFALTPGDLDTAVLVQLEPGTYTVTLKGLNGTTGEVLAEIYDVSRNGTRLTNLSTLAKISTEGELLIPGIVIAGNNPRTLVVRAVAQGLGEFGLPADTLLGDPRISILTTQNGNTQTVATNNNWAQAGAATLNAAFPAVGAFPLRAASDAALVDALAPGSYTLQAGAAPLPTGGAGPATFVAPAQTGSILVEVYEVP